MNSLKLGAIALILIVACPLVLGYALASEDNEYTVTKETDTTPITDVMLNAESDYFTDYSKINNNSTMLQRVTAQGSNYYTYVSPDYVEAGDTYTSLPAYITTSYTSTIVSDPSTDSVSVTDAFPYYSGVSIGSVAHLQAEWEDGYDTLRLDANFNPRSYTTYTMTAENTSYALIDGVVDTSYDATNPALAGGIAAQSVIAIYEGDDTWTFIINGVKYTDRNWVVLASVRPSTVSYVMRAFTQVNPTVDTEAVQDWHLDFSDLSGVKLTYPDESVEYVTASTISHTSNLLMIDNVEYEYPSRVDVSTYSGNLTYYTRTYSEFANPAYGWYNAESTYQVYRNAWYNQFSNATVMFYVHFDGQGQTDFYEDFSAVSPIISLKRFDDVVTATDTDGNIYEVGKYQSLQVIFDTFEDSVKVYGISEFPAMGAVPQTYNSVTIDYDFDGYIEQLVIVDQYSTIGPPSADYYMVNGQSITIPFELARPYTTLTLRLNNQVVTEGWSGVLADDNSSVVFTATDLDTGLYQLEKYGAPQGGSEFFYIYVGSISGPVSTSPISYRVDGATIVAGDYPSTINYTLDLFGMFPQDSTQSVYFNSIGVYGSSLVIHGTLYYVADNSIEITDIDTGETHTIKLLKSTIRMINDDGQYSVYVNGYRVSTGAGAPTIYFAGEWSLTATRGTIEEVTEVKSEWVPGEFALDMDGFVLAMVITAVGAFVVLGMSGARSGAKVALLALVCGGACAVGFLMI